MNGINNRSCETCRSSVALVTKRCAVCLDFDQWEPLTIICDEMRGGHQDQGRKDDQDKARWDLVPMSAVEEVVKVFTMGSRKYGPRNWEKGIAWSRVFAAVMRHLCAWRKGEDMDLESGLPHLSHAAWGCLALIEYDRTRREFDDRVQIQDGSDE